MPQWLLICALFAVGTCIGSFLNVCISRIPRKMSIVFPASHCPSCRHPIPFYCNLPLISYLFLGGKCKFCGTPIAFHYFFVELLTPAVIIYLYLHFGLSGAFTAACAFSAALLVITFIDLNLHIIPDVISLPGIPLGFLCSFVVPWTSPADSLLGILVGGGILYLVAWGYELLTKKEGMGGGDIKLLAMIGSFLGWKGALSSLMIAAFTGSIIGIILIVFTGKTSKYAIPFGPFLAVGAFAALLYQEAIIGFYLRLGGH